MGSVCANSPQIEYEQTDIKTQELYGELHGDGDDGGMCNFSDYGGNSGNISDGEGNRGGQQRGGGDQRDGGLGPLGQQRGGGDRGDGGLGPLGQQRGGQHGGSYRGGYQRLSFLGQLDQQRGDGEENIINVNMEETEEEEEVEKSVEHISKLLRRLYDEGGEVLLCHAVQRIFHISKYYENNQATLDDKDEVLSILKNYEPFCLMEDWNHCNNNNNQKKQAVESLLMVESNCNGNGLFYVAFCIQIIGFIFAILKTMPFEPGHCSKFEFVSWNNCENWTWIAQLISYVTATFIVVMRFCYMKENEFKLFQFIFKRLYSPFIGWIILMLIDCLYLYVTNKEYVFQVGIDFFGYIVFFIQGLFVILMRIYTKHDKGCMICPQKLGIMRIISCVYFFMCFFVICCKVSTNNSHTLHAHNTKVSETTVKAIAFIQIVFENMLLFYWINYVYFGSIEHQDYCFAHCESKKKI